MEKLSKDYIEALMLEVAFRNLISVGTMSTAKLADEVREEMEDRIARFTDGQLAAWEKRND